MQRINRVGQRFGKLSVTVFREARRTGNTGKMKTFWECLCDCGKVVVISADNLPSSLSCGCTRSESLKTHGMTGSRIYVIWQRMIDRCYKPGNISFRYYGGRGIAVCDEWRGSFAQFYSDMGLPPSPKHTLDRRDNDGDYRTDNCRWATALEQARHKRNSLVLTVNGVTKCASAWAEERGISPFTVYTRVARGWNDQDAVFGRAN